MNFSRKLQRKAAAPAKPSGPKYRVRDAWTLFERAILPPDCSDVQRTEMRRVTVRMSPELEARWIVVCARMEAENVQLRRLRWASRAVIALVALGVVLAIVGVACPQTPVYKAAAAIATTAGVFSGLVWLGFSQRLHLQMRGTLGEIRAFSEALLGELPR